MRETFVRGGSETARLIPYEEEEMARRRSLSDEQAVELFNMVHKGFSNKDIAKKFGIAESTVKTYYRRVLRDRGKEAKRNGGGPRLVVMREGGAKLTFGVDEGYVGTCSVGGVVDEHVLEAKEDVAAIVEFDEWLGRMREEQEFLDRLERKHEEPVDDDAAYVATWDTASVASILRKYSDGKLLRDADRDTDVAIACEERDARMAEREDERKRSKARGKEREGMVSRKDTKVESSAGTAYAIIAVQPKIKGYGMYADMDAAFSKLDQLNEVTNMLGIDGAFEVHEMEWRG